MSSSRLRCRAPSGLMMSLRKSSTLRAYSAEDISRHERGQVGLADQGHAVVHDGLTRLGQRAVAALRGRQSSR